jgi:lycopene beta-cyclase
MIKADYIILGAGASGLLLAYRMANDAFFDGMSIIILDKEKDKGNDRTWCYWEEGSGEWDDILHMTWSKIYFGSEWFSSEIPLKSYSYKMIRSESFYQKLWKTINSKSNIQFHKAEVSAIENLESSVQIQSNDGVFEAKKVFNSLRLNDELNRQQKYPVLQQHFVGWFIKTKTPYFDADVATFMDFDIPQKGNTRFMYILPTSQTEALFEYTLFSKHLLSKREYENAIKVYLDEKGIADYTIEEKEYGSIPMTSYKFHSHNSKNILHIGTAGGWTKASTGYTFRNTTKKTKSLIEYLKSGSDLSGFESKSRFWFYDMLMLDVLAENNDMGSRLFSSLFKKSKLKTIFRFLDEESNFAEEVSIMASVPSGKFIKALFNRMY